jgi:hypothetical protein
MQDNDINLAKKDPQTAEEILLNDLKYDGDSKTLFIQENSDILLINVISHKLSSEYIEELHISFMNDLYYCDLSFLENIPYIKRLYITATTRRGNVENFESIKFLNSLEHLVLSYLNVDDISPLDSLKNLKVLLLGTLEQLDNISTLANLKKVTDITSIYNLDKLESLDISRSDNMKKINIIFENLMSLKILRLSDITQDELNNLVNLKQLRELYISGSKFNNIRPLLDLPNLVFIKFNSISIDIVPLVQLILPLIESSSLKKIYIDFETDERKNEFYKNIGNIFYENDIYIDEPGDYR